MHEIRKDFPILAREVNGKPLVYLDNGASAQKPQVVIDAVTQAYSMEYANVHRGLALPLDCGHREVRGGPRDRRALPERRERAGDRDDHRDDRGHQPHRLRLGHAADGGGDEIVLSIMEHHANIVPWHFLRERQGVVLKWVETDANGVLDPQRVIDAIGPRTKLVAVTHLSNVLGTRST